MEVCLNLFLLTLICVYIIDVARFPDSIKSGLSILLGYKVVHLKPLDCSLCASFWVGLLYLLITAQCNILNIAILLTFSVLTTNIADFIFNIKDLITRLIRLI